MSSVATSALRLPAWLMILRDTLLEKIAKKQRKGKERGWVDCLKSLMLNYGNRENKLLLSKRGVGFDSLKGLMLNYWQQRKYVAII